MCTQNSCLGNGHQLGEVWLDEIYAGAQKQSKDNQVSGSHRRRQNAAELPIASEPASVRCRAVRTGIAGRASASLTAFDRERDLREPVLSLREPIVPLDGAPAGAPPNDFASFTVEAVDEAKAVASRKQLDTLVLVTSVLARQHKLGHPPPDHVDAELGPALRFLGRATGGSQRAWLASAFDACANTTFLEHGRSDRRIPLFRHAEQLVGGRVRIHLDPWLTEAVKAEKMLRIEPAALQLSPIERRLYSFARARVGRPEGDGCAIDFWDIYDRSGSRDAPRKFRNALTRAIRHDRIPGFHFAMTGTGPGLVLHVTPQKETPAPSSTAAAPQASLIVLEGFGDETKPPPHKPIHLRDLVSADDWAAFSRERD